MYYTHINRGIIDSNRKNGTNNPPIAVKRGKYGKSEYGFEIEFPAKTKAIYSPHEPILPCGARLVITSEEKPIFLR